MSDGSRMRADTFNILVAAVVLVTVALVGVGGMFLASRDSCGEERRQVSTTDGMSEELVSYRFTEVCDGPLIVPSREEPWRRAEVEAVAGEMMSPDAFYGKEVPYLVARPSIQAHPQALFALAELARAMPETAGVSLRLECGYLSWDAAGGAAGTTPYHTGYTLQVSLAVKGEGTLDLTMALNHPIAAAPAAWLGANMTSYGFVRGEGGSQLLYVGVPHAACMTAGGDTPQSYVEGLRGVQQTSPRVYTTAQGDYHLFYVPAEWGAAVIQVSSRAAVTAVGDGESGFVVTLFFPTTEESVSAG